MPTFGMYNAAKWALEGFSEALAAEVAAFGIRVTIAEDYERDPRFAWPAPLREAQAASTRLHG